MENPGATTESVEEKFRTWLRGGSKDFAPLGCRADPDHVKIPGQSSEDLVTPPPAHVPLVSDQGNDANIGH